MATPSTAANRARSARPNCRQSHSMAASTGRPSRKNHRVTSPVSMNMRTTAKITMPVTSPASRWMTASQVGADTTGRAARSSPRTGTLTGGCWPAGGWPPGRAAYPGSVFGHRLLRCSSGPPAVFRPDCCIPGLPVLRRAGSGPTRR